MEKDRESERERYRWNQSGYIDSILMVSLHILAHLNAITWHCFYIIYDVFFVSFAHSDDGYTKMATKYGPSLQYFVFIQIESNAPNRVDSLDDA